VGKDNAVAPDPDPRMGVMDIDEARKRIRERSDLNAFISISEESGHGTLVAVKDLVDVKGMATTAGGIILPDVPAAADAPVIKRIRAAGCLIVGKANLHEFAYGVTSVNPHYGTVRNPHDPGRVAGGSSGGSAVAVAAGMCDWAIGSDTGGSIRIPCSLCGVSGFKPAFGSIDIGGVIPLSKSLDTLGPIAPDMASTARAYTMMSGEDVPLDRLSRPRLGVPAGWVRDLDSPTSAAWALVSQGLPEVQFMDHGRLFEVGLTILLFEAAAYHRRWATEFPDKYGADVLRLIRRGLEGPAVDYGKATKERPRARWKGSTPWSCRPLASSPPRWTPARKFASPWPGSRDRSTRRTSRSPCCLHRPAGCRSASRWSAAPTPKPCAPRCGWRGSGPGSRGEVEGALPRDLQPSRRGV